MKETTETTEKIVFYRRDAKNAEKKLYFFVYKNSLQKMKSENNDSSKES
jgi:hypothetical protein